MATFTTSSKSSIKESDWKLVERINIPVVYPFGGAKRVWYTASLGTATNTAILTLVGPVHTARAQEEDTGTASALPS